METETIIILFIDLEKTCNENWTDHIVDKIDAKYPFKEKYLYFYLIHSIYPLTLKT